MIIYRKNAGLVVGDLLIRPLSFNLTESLFIKRGGWIRSSFWFYDPSGANLNDRKSRLNCSFLKKYHFLTLKYIKSHSGHFGQGWRSLPFILLFYFLKYFYWLCYYSFPFSPFYPPSTLSPQPSSIPPLSSCPWVVRISSLSPLFPIPFFISPCLFYAY